MSITQIGEFKKVSGNLGVVMSIDYGIKKVGIAICDPTMSITMPYKTIVENKMLRLIDIIRKIVEDKQVIYIVLGMPLNLDNSSNKQTEIVKHFANTLVKRIEVPIFLYDERFSSRVADEMLKNIGLNRKRRSNIDDAIAAKIILDDFLSEIKG